MNTTAPTVPTTALDPKVDRRIVLSILWVAMLLVFAYIDIFGFWRADVIRGVLAGEVPGPGFAIDQAFLTMTTLYVLVPILMVVVSLLAPARANRAANIVLGPLCAVSVVAAAVSETWVYYILGSAVEVVLLLAITKVAWTWQPTSVGAAARGPVAAGPCSSLPWTSPVGTQLADVLDATSADVRRCRLRVVTPGDREDDGLVPPSLPSQEGADDATVRDPHRERSGARGRSSRLPRRRVHRDRYTRTDAAHVTVRDHSVTGAESSADAQRLTGAQRVAITRAERVAESPTDRHDVVDDLRVHPLRPEHRVSARLDGAALGPRLDP